MTQECAEYRALYEKMVLPPSVGPRVDWARVLEQKQVRGHPQSRGHLRELESHPAAVGAVVCHPGPDSVLHPGGS